MSKYVVVGGGISGLYLAFLLKQKHSTSEVIVIEKEAYCGGLLKSFQYPNDHGIFDYGIHTLYETGIKELDENLLSFLPMDEWIQLSGKKRDYGGAYINGVLQSNSPYIDIRNSKLKNIKKYQQDFLGNLINLDVSKSKNAKDRLLSKYGKLITQDIFEPVIQKLYSFGSELADPFITKLLPLDRVVLFNEKDMLKLNQLNQSQQSLAHPEQLDLPDSLVTQKSAWYPKDHGMFRLVDKIKSTLENIGVEIKTSTKLLDVSKKKDISKIDIDIDIENEKKNTIKNVDKIFWTSGVISAYFALNKNDDIKPSLDKPVSTAFVNIGVKIHPKLKGLFYVWCLETGFISYRISCPSNFCPSSYKDGIHRLTVEVVLKEDRDEGYIREKTISELEIMGVLHKSDIKFSYVEKIPGGYPTISIKNTSEIEVMRKSLQSQYPGFLDFVGLMSKPDLFFQTDVLVDIHHRFR